MAGKLSNETLLQQLKHGLAEFELVSSPVLSISSHKPNSPIRLRPNSLLSDNTHRFFARIGSSLGGASPAMKKLERYAVQKVTGDGRCLFRALVLMVKGMAFNKGIALNPREERENADELRMAVKEVLCDNDKERLQYEEALVAITVEESLKRCYQSCVASRSLYTYQNTSIQKVDGALVLFPLQSMELSFVRVQEKENQGKL
ncbi:uncharacterized protein LOC114270165 isoform X3 [Camellia sinensis]|uniref:uncharacterized protein LOC114270165 isoform X3 n=1 Tax=Camellia sinensis TaxID=4442 RepID=UPI0010356EE3|nr:uncharacterized protein LOC114270165 isoform X3 [Camellia sinensis]